MKKKGIILSIVGIVLISSFLLIIISKNTTKTFMKDEVKFAVSVDGVSQSSFPSRGKYHVDVDCENALGKWLSKTWELRIENITGTVTCNIDFTTIESTDVHNTLVSFIEDSTKLVSQGNTGVVDESSDNAGYRYEGKNPNNYIWFNDEMWRII